MANELLEAARAFLDRNDGWRVPGLNQFEEIAHLMADFARSQTGWVATSERLPTEAGHYLVFCKVGNPKNSQHIAYWSVDRERWMAMTNNVTDDAANRNIVAWRPLPSPFVPAPEAKV